MYKKIYLEITNNCNLNCSFCPHNKRTNKFMSMEEFKSVLSKIEGHTNYLYFHVLGEPLLHPSINEFIDYASSNFKINITTNGYLIKRIEDNKNIRQLNISLQSYTDNLKISLNEYLDNIFSSIEKLKKYTYISLRLWVKNNYTKEILEYLSKRYSREINLTKNGNITLEENVFLSNQEEFIWPNINNEKVYKEGTCYALKDHIGILADGTVIPCCLDGEGIINLGNIFKDDLKDIILSSRYQNMLGSFKNNKKCEGLCQTCNFIK